ncbi:neocarzinostatin apoprotein domain-containing protein, partial [Micromonospora aurantiaca (nom. illeg.)]|uniref:neocarzinostatin apoprotein domain-containing protein n=2 Tax=Micromonospora aurantiaca (nom. illeg.) TaxID=47850 RepID=UPI0019C3970D
MRARRRTILTTVLLTAAAVVATPAPAHAGTATGSGGQKLTVTPSTDLSRSGATVSVSGRGYDVDKGIYVAYCVDNGPGVAATPCGGGADTTGSLGASQWISSNPPAYAEGLPKPYGPGGSFSVTVKVTPTIGDVDCTVRRCAVVTRADHTRASDRSQDVRVPVTFAAGATSAPSKA